MVILGKKYVFVMSRLIGYIYKSNVKVVSEKKIIVVECLEFVFVYFNIKVV